MKKLLTFLLSVLLLVSGAFALVACGREKVMVYFPDGTPGLALALAITEGVSETNVTFKFEPVPATEIAGVVANGEADLAIMPTTAAATLYGKKNVKIQLMSTNVFGNLYVVGYGENRAEDLHGLVGKVVYYTTGTTVDIKQVAAYSDLINNETLNDLIQENLERVIPIGYTEEELDYARKFQSVITELDKEGLKAIAADIGGRDRKKELLETPLWDFIVDRNSRYGGGGSTDVGDVSWKVPTAHVYVNCYAAGTALHSWQATAQGKSSIAHKGMIAAAKVMANIGAELLLKPELVEKAKEDWKEELNGEEYPNPLPKDLKPEIW